MIEVIIQHLGPMMMVLVRLGGLFIFAPVLGSPMIPGRIKALLVVILAVAVYPLLSSAMVSQVPANASLMELVPLMAMEVSVGLMIGFVAMIPLFAMQTSGLVMGQQMGLGFARFYNPASDSEADVLEQLLFYLALATFLAMGGLEAMVLSLVRSFEYVQVGQMFFGSGAIRLLTGLLLSAMEIGLRIAAPLLALIFLETVAMGFVAKTVPQLNILSLGFPLRIIMGIATILAGLVVIESVMITGIERILDSLFTWFQGFPGTST